MAWGARQWLAIMPEATYGTYDSGGTLVYIRLASDSAFTMIPKPMTHDIRDAGGGNRKVQRVTSRYGYSGTLTTPLYPTQANSLLAWASTITSNDTGSYSINHYDGVRTRRYLGAKVNKGTISCSSTDAEGVLTLSLELTAQTTAADPTFTEPAFSVFPTVLPYTIQQSSTQFSIAATARTKYNRFSCSIANILKPQFDELAYISSLPYCGRDVSFSTSFQYTASTDTAAHEAQTALDTTIAFVHGTNTLTLDFQSVGRLTTRARSMPLGDVSREDYTLDALYESAGGTDFSFGIV